MVAHMTNLADLFTANPLVWIFILLVILLLILLIIQMFKSLKLKHSLTILAAILMLLTLAIVFRDDVTDVFMYQKFCMPSPSKDKIAIIIWTDEPEGIIIENKAAAKAYKSYFDILWENAKSIK